MSGIPCSQIPGCTTTNQFRNVGRLEIKGLQADARWTPASYRFQANYTFTSPRDPDRDQRVGDIASHRLNFLGGTRLFGDRLDTELRVNGVLGRKTGAGTTVNNNPFPKIADYFIVSAAFTYRRLVPGVDLQFAVENLFNQDYWDPSLRNPSGFPIAAQDSSTRHDCFSETPGHSLSMRSLARLLGIQAGEGAPVAWLIVHSLFNGIFSAFFLTAANALFLARFPITMLPLAYIGAAGVGYVSVMLFSRLERRVSIGVALLVNLGVLLTLASAFWIVRKSTDADWVVFWMFVAVGPMFNLISLGYWGLAGRLFDLRQAKRLFGLIGAGEELSTIVALFSTPLLIRLIGDPGNLVLLAAAGLAGSFATVAFMSWRFNRSLAAPAGSAKRHAKAAVGLLDLLRVRYFLLMASCVVLLNLALYTVDFSFLAQVRIQFQGPGQIAQFFGIFFGALKIVELLMKVGVSGPLLSHFGLNVGLLVLPVLLSVSAGFAIMVGSFGLGAANFFVLVALSKLVAVVGRSSTFEPSFRVLYQSVGPSERFAYQSHVEGTARQFSIGAIGLALLLFSRGGAFNALLLFYLLIPILALWIVAAILVHKEYRVRLFEGLKQHAGTTEVRGPLDVLLPYLRSEAVDHRRRALRVIERIEPGSLHAALSSALDGQRSPARVAALECVGSGRIVDLEPQVARDADRARSKS